MESLVDFYDGQSSDLFSSLASPDSHEIHMRVITLFLFLIFGFLVQMMFNKYKKTELENLKINSELNQIFQTAADGMRIIDSHFNMVKVNRTFLEMVKMKEEEVIGHSCYEIFKGDNCHTPSCPLTMILKNKCRVECECMKFCPDGTEIDCFITATPYYDANSNVIGIVEDFKDMTPLREAEKEKIKLHADLKQAQKMEAIGMLAGGIAHDFNNILTSIIGYSELIKDYISKNAPASKPDQHIDRVLKAGGRAQQLVKQILSFSRKDSQKIYFFDPLPIIQESLHLLRASIPVTIEFRQDITLDCGEMLGEPVKLQQIVINLCTNALHAMEQKGGILTLRLRCIPLNFHHLNRSLDMEVNHLMELTISDTGHGIPQNIIDKIFDPYYTTKTSDKGTGMGLAVVNEIVKDFEGTINVKSEPGKGTTFTIVFPAKDTENMIAPCKKLKKNTMPQGSENVLIIDDDISIAELIQIQLQKLGYGVTVKTESPDAFEYFKKNPEKVDAIITDQTMPVMTGEQLAKKILKLKPDIPIILCSGYSSKINLEKTLKSGIKEFIPKPIDHFLLTNTLRKHLDIAKLK